jgi:ribosomal protein S18 acetylase RimI-like enzyme
MEISRRWATEADRELARRVHHEAYRDVVERQFGRWVEAEQNRFFERGWADARHEIVLCDGEPCGYVCVEERAEDVHVRELVILPRFQGRGIGTALLGEAIERARGRGRPVRLGTFHVNRAAELYRRLGFRETARTRTHILMEWRPWPRDEDA